MKDKKKKVNNNSAQFLPPIFNLGQILFLVFTCILFLFLSPSSSLAQTLISPEEALSSSHSPHCSVVHLLPSLPQLQTSCNGSLSICYASSAVTAYEAILRQQKIIRGDFTLSPISAALDYHHTQQWLPKIKRFTQKKTTQGEVPDFRQDRQLEFGLFCGALETIHKKGLCNGRNFEKDNSQETLNFLKGLLFHFAQSRTENPDQNFFEVARAMCSTQNFLREDLTLLGQAEAINSQMAQENALMTVHQALGKVGLLQYQVLIEAYCKDQWVRSESHLACHNQWYPFSSPKKLQQRIQKALEHFQNFPHLPQAITYNPNGQVHLKLTQGVRQDLHVSLLMGYRICGGVKEFLVRDPNFPLGMLEWQNAETLFQQTLIHHTLELH